VVAAVVAAVETVLLGGLAGSVDLGVAAAVPAVDRDLFPVFPAGLMAVAVVIGVSSGGGGGGGGGGALGGAVFSNTTSTINLQQCQRQWQQCDGR